MRHNLHLLFFFIIASHLLSAQEVLELDTLHRCIYSGGVVDVELYLFPNNNKVEIWAKEIVELGGADLNFELVQTNVENVSAVLDGGKRYLLYNLDFVEKNSDLNVIGALAHEVGHHANAHTFSVTRRKIEELEADYFMGYVLSKKGFSKTDIEIFLRKIPSSYEITFEERWKAVLEGFEQAVRAMQIKSLPFDNDPLLEGLTSPSFPYPPPLCNARFDLPETSFVGFKTLGDVAYKVRTALDAKGYAQHSYFSVPNGFALVTQLEQYNDEDGSVRNDGTRWLDYPQKDNFGNIVDYLTSIVMPQPGHFRLFVFVVTNQAFGSGSQHVSKEQATDWLNQGFNKLPRNIAAMLFSTGYDVTALVYEFVVPETTHKPEQQCPSPLFDAKTHLVRAGMAGGLGF